MFLWFAAILYRKQHDIIIISEATNKVRTTSSWDHEQKLSDQVTQIVWNCWRWFCCIYSCKTASSPSTYQCKSVDPKILWQWNKIVIDVDRQRINLSQFVYPDSYNVIATKRFCNTWNVWKSMARDRIEWKSCWFDCKSSLRIGKICVLGLLEW